jgi:hypothetical protein
VAGVPGRDLLGLGIRVAPVGIQVLWGAVGEGGVLGLGDDHLGHQEARGGGHEGGGQQVVERDPEQGVADQDRPGHGGHADPPPRTLMTTCMTFR